MQYSTVVTLVAALAAAAPITTALIQPHIRPTHYQSLTRSHRYSSATQLSMAFPLKEGQTTNMFEGPAALTQERDACGVGFIVNTQHGGRPFDFKEI